MAVTPEVIRAHRVHLLMTIHPSPYPDVAALDYFEAGVLDRNEAEDASGLDDRQFSGNLVKRRRERKAETRNRTRKLSGVKARYQEVL